MDKIPVVSVINNTVNIIGKLILILILKPFAGQEAIDNNLYFKYLDEKSFARPISLIAFPVIGNVFVSAYDKVEKDDIQDLAQNNPDAKTIPVHLLLDSKIASVYGLNVCERAPALKKDPVFLLEVLKRHPSERTKVIEIIDNRFNKEFIDYAKQKHTQYLIQDINAGKITNLNQIPPSNKENPDVLHALIKQHGIHAFPNHINNYDLAFTLLTKDFTTDEKIAILSEKVTPRVKNMTFLLRELVKEDPALQNYMNQWFKQGESRDIAYMDWHVKKIRREQSSATI